jgi:hypothetical protein
MREPSKPEVRLAPDDPVNGSDLPAVDADRAASVAVPFSAWVSIDLFNFDIRCR